MIHTSIEVDLSGEMFRLPNHKQMKLCVNKTGQPYREQGGRITYSLSCLLNRMSQQPTPYILEMLMLRPDCEDESLDRIIQHPQLIFDRGLPHALHGKIYRHYLTQVRDRVQTQPQLPIGAAGEVFRWLHLTSHIMQHALLPADYQEAEAEWAQLGVCKPDNTSPTINGSSSSSNRYDLRTRLSAEKLNACRQAGIRRIQSGLASRSDCAVATACSGSLRGTEKFRLWFRLERVPEPLLRNGLQCN
jgi:hypothetical protein